MTWYYDAASATQHGRRASVSVNNTGGSASAIDISITIPKEWDQFWTEINQTDGRDIRICDADGVTVLTYQLVGFTLATRTLSIEVDGYSAPAGEMCQLWLYWNNAAASSVAGSFVAAAAKTGTVHICEPAGKRIVATAERFKDQRPRNTLSKHSSESLYFTLDVGPLLNQRPMPYAFKGHRECEEIDYVSYRVLAAGVASGTMIDESLIRFVGGRYIQLILKAGSDGTGYTVEVTIVTTEGQTFVRNVWLEVRNTDEA